MHTLQKMALVSAGAVAGAILSLSITAMADKEPASTTLPLTELRTFTEVFGHIKQDYVEPVEDKKLITEAKYTNGITVEALAMQILAAEKSQKSAFIDNRQTDANDLNGITANGQPDAKSQEAEFLAVFDGEKNA